MLIFVTEIRNITTNSKQYEKGYILCESKDRETSCYPR